MRTADTSTRYGWPPAAPAHGNGAVAEFRFYEELNDFLPVERRKISFLWPINGAPAVKDPIEAIGVPHTEVELILVNGVSVEFTHRIHAGDRVAVYPMFEAFDVTPLLKLRERPLRHIAFICDVPLGKLARRLRLLGFDTLYRNDYQDAEVVRIAATGRRIVLTRDRRLLFHKAVTHGYFVRSPDVTRQLDEVLRRFDLGQQVRPFHRCLVCNGPITMVAKASISDQLEPLTRRYYQQFYRCQGCGKVYWRGSHYQHMQRHLPELPIPDEPPTG